MIKLFLNDTKTELVIMGTRQQLAKVNIDGLCVGERCIAPVTSVRNLGSWFDENMNMVTHIKNIYKAATFHLCNIRRIRKYLVTNNTTQTLVHAVIMSRTDYCNSLCESYMSISSSAYQIVLPVWSVLYLGLITKHLYYICYTGYLYLLERNFTILVLTLKPIYGIALSYISNLVETKEQPHYNLQSSKNSYYSHLELKRREHLRHFRTNCIQTLNL